MSMTSLFHFAATRGNNCGTNNGLLPGLYDHLCVGGKVQILGVADIFTVISNVIRILMALAGGIAVIAIIAAGIYYVTSAGDPTRVKQAKSVLIQAITGLIVIILAYAVVTFIAGAF